THESVAASRQRLDPAVAAGFLAKHLSQRSDLYAQVALFDRQARPCCIDQLVFGHGRPLPHHQGMQEGNGATAKRDGFGTLKKDLSLSVQAKRSKSVDGRHRQSDLDSKTFWTFSGPLHDIAQAQPQAVTSCRTWWHQPTKGSRAMTKPTDARLCAED